MGLSAFNRRREKLDKQPKLDAKQPEPKGSEPKKPKGK